MLIFSFQKFILKHKGEPVAYDQHEYHVAACVLKAFVRELPESLLSESIFSEIVSLEGETLFVYIYWFKITLKINHIFVALDVADKVEVARDLLSAKLPKYNYIILNYIIGFMSEVSKHSAQNRMDARNLSYVFGPNFLRKSLDTEYGLIDIERINNFVELLIKYHSDIFSKD